MEINVQNEKRVSVCMATYNGEKYICKQLDTIIANLTDRDELIISDDGSTDNTVTILQQYQLKYPYITILNGPKKGVIKNFENALINSHGKYIFLSDQDDEWMKNKVERMIKEFENSKVMAVVHDAVIVDAENNEINSSLFKIRNSKKGLCKNLIKNSYVGCCMAVRRELVEKALPFPENIEMHDWWLGLISDCKKGSVFIDDKLINYRRHDSNVSGMKHYPLFKMVKNRMIFIIELFRRNKYEIIKEE